jgi:hypothetical protein
MLSTVTKVLLVALSSLDDLLGRARGPGTPAAHTVSHTAEAITEARPGFGARPLVLVLAGRDDLRLPPRFKFHPPSLQPQ